MFIAPLGHTHPHLNIRFADDANHDLAWSNRLQYTGGLLDAATGLYRFGVRWYDPNTGRFTPDPTSQDTNPYLYAAGNPCNNTDLSDAACTKAAGITLAVFGVGLTVAGPLVAGAAVVTAAGLAGGVTTAATLYGTGVGLAGLVCTINS